MWCQGASYLCGNTLTYSTHYPMTPMQFLPMRVYILLSFVFNNRGFVHRRNIMKTVEEKAKALLIDIENFCNKACTGVLNTKTNALPQTSLRDGMIQSVGNMLKSKVVSNNKMQKSVVKDIANDAILQATQTDDFAVMRQTVLFITQKYPGRVAETSEERAIREMSA